MTKHARPPPGDRPAPTAPPPGWRHWLLPLALGVALTLWVVLPALHAGRAPTHNFTYSRFLADVSSRQVKTVTIIPAG